MRKLILTVAAVVSLAGAAMAAGQFYPLSVPEMARWSATHCLEFKSADFSAFTSTNTAALVTNSIPAKTAVECVGMVLDSAFEGQLTPTNHPATSVSLKVGTASDDDLYLTATELASDGTEVYVKYAPAHAYTVALSFLKTAVTNDVVNQVVTGGTATATASDLGRSLYASAGKIITSWTPNADEAMSYMTAGKVRIFFKLHEWGK